MFFNPAPSGAGAKQVSNPELKGLASMLFMVDFFRRCNCAHAANQHVNRCVCVVSNNDWQLAHRGECPRRREVCLLCDCFQGTEPPDPFQLAVAVEFYIRGFFEAVHVQRALVRQPQAPNPWWGRQGTAVASCCWMHALCTALPVLSAREGLTGEHGYTS